MRSLPSIEEVRASFSYDHVRGVLIWRERNDKRWNTMIAGRVAGSLNQNGYTQILWNRRHFPAHRIIWAWVNGAWPQDQIDHIDGNRTNNRISNLREATQLENGQNLAMRPNNSTGFMGVSFHVGIQRWVAQIRFNGKQNHLGAFNSAEEASAAYLRAKRENHTFQPTPRMQNHA